MLSGIRTTVLGILTTRRCRQLCQPSAPIAFMPASTLTCRKRGTTIKARGNDSCQVCGTWTGCGMSRCGHPSKLSFEWRKARQSLSTMGELRVCSPSKWGLRYVCIVGCTKSSSIQRHRGQLQRPDSPLRGPVCHIWQRSRSSPPPRVVSTNRHSFTGSPSWMQGLPWGLTRTRSCGLSLSCPSRCKGRRG